jgi:hypothetical protein
MRSHKLFCASFMQKDNYASNRKMDAYAFLLLTEHETCRPSGLAS